MRVQGIERASFTVLVTSKEAPEAGSTFRDPRGHVWTQRGQASPFVGLVNPPPPEPLWRISVDSDHHTNRLHPGDQLEQLS